MTHQEAALPLVLYSHVTRLHLGQCDCDCACALDLPAVLVAPRATNTLDCACACALQTPAEQPAPAASEPWVKQPDLLEIPIQAPGGWQAYFNPGGPLGIAVLNAEARRVLAAFDSPLSLDRAQAGIPGLSLPLVESTVASLAQTGLLYRATTPLALPAGSSVLSAWLHITEACNLNCPYCHVHKRPRTISPKVGRRAVDRLFEMAERHGHTRLKLKYAGGEPTLAFPLIQALHAHAVQRATEKALGLEEVVLTNGLGLSDEVLDFVAQARMRLMVSLDGGPASHDRLRARRDGRSTHFFVTSAIERALERGLGPNISITLTAFNLDGASEAVAFALERGLPFNLNFYRECAWSASSASLTPSPDRLLDTMMDIFELVRLYPAYPLPLSGILDRARLDVPHEYACSAGRDYLAVNIEGQVSACQMMLEQPWTDLDAVDPLFEIRQRGASLFTPVGEQSDCAACPWKTACSGGCPLMRNSTLHDEYCRVYRALFPELIRLEAARLISHRVLRVTEIGEGRGVRRKSCSMWSLPTERWSQPRR